MMERGCVEDQPRRSEGLCICGNWRVLCYCDDPLTYLLNNLSKMDSRPTLR
jgi:hypothetical protein